MCQVVTCPGAAANIVWLATVGWALALGHLMAAIFSVGPAVGMRTPPLPPPPSSGLPPDPLATGPP